MERILKVQSTTDCRTFKAANISNKFSSTNWKSHPHFKQIRVNVIASVLSVFTWRRGGHVRVQSNSEKGLLGIWFYDYAKLEPHFAIVLFTNMAFSPCEWKPWVRIRSYMKWVKRQLLCVPFVAGLTNPWGIQSFAVSLFVASGYQWRIG